MHMDKPTTHTPCWVELGTSDPEAAKRFYAAVFGWRAATDPRPEAGGYTILHLGESTADAPVAALMGLMGEGQPTAWSIAFSVTDADAAVAAVRKAGGSLIVDPMDVFEEGRYAVVADPSGAAFALWQPRAFDGFTSYEANGGMCWAELHTDDTAGAERFYPAVFGWTVRRSVDFYAMFSLGEADFGGLAGIDEEHTPGARPHWLPYFGVEDVDAAVERAAAAGGRAVMGPVQVPDGPYIAVVSDPQGAVFGLLRGAA
ncbi:VOC family protein [Phaeacidiphilus oryzae]|uniref:VOC family protein n=1 Tax=Phaeacidiphilus oryzae TaxID=348818 RepID=UPI0005668AD0|nr:VOC family protein [Phaeacidiphilus oryzae]